MLKTRLLNYLVDARCVCLPRYTAVKLGASESAVRRAANELVAEGKAERRSLWVSRGFHYRRAGYVAGYRAVDDREARIYCNCGPSHPIWEVYLPIRDGRGYFEKVAVCATKSAAETWCEERGHRIADVSS